MRGWCSTSGPGCRTVWCLYRCLQTSLNWIIIWCNSEKNLDQWKIYLCVQHAHVKFKRILLEALKAKAQLESHPTSVTSILPNSCWVQFFWILSSVGVALFKLSLLTVFTNWVDCIQRLVDNLLQQKHPKHLVSTLSVKMVKSIRKAQLVTIHLSHWRQTVTRSQIPTTA